MKDNTKSRGRLGVLLALAEGPKHGYQIAKYLKEKTEGYFSLSFGALYPILHRLERDGYVLGALRPGRTRLAAALGRADLVAGLRQLPELPGAVVALAVALADGRTLTFLVLAVSLGHGVTPYGFPAAERSSSGLRPRVIM